MRASLSVFLALSALRASQAVVGTWDAFGLGGVGTAGTGEVRVVVQDTRARQRPCYFIGGRFSSFAGLYSPRLVHYCFDTGVATSLGVNGGPLPGFENLLGYVSAVSLRISDNHLIVAGFIPNSGNIFDLDLSTGTFVPILTSAGNLLTRGCSGGDVLALQSLSNGDVLVGGTFFECGVPTPGGIAVLKPPVAAVPGRSVLRPLYAQSGGASGIVRAFAVVQGMPGLNHSSAIAVCGSFGAGGVLPQTKTLNLAFLVGENYTWTPVVHAPQPALQGVDGAGPLQGCFGVAAAPDPSNSSITSELVFVGHFNGAAADPSLFSLSPNVLSPGIVRWSPRDGFSSPLKNPSALVPQGSLQTRNVALQAVAVSRGVIYASGTISQGAGMPVSLRHIVAIRNGTFGPLISEQAGAPIGGVGDAPVLTITPYPDGSRVVFGGAFLTAGGSSAGLSQVLGFQAPEPGISSPGIIAWERSYLASSNEAAGAIEERGKWHQAKAASSSTTTSANFGGSGVAGSVTAVASFAGMTWVGYAGKFAAGGVIYAPGLAIHRPTTGFSNVTTFIMPTTLAADKAVVVTAFLVEPPSVYFPSGSIVIAVDPTVSMLSLGTGSSNPVPLPGGLARCFPSPAAPVASGWVCTSAFPLSAVGSTLSLSPVAVVGISTVPPPIAYGSRIPAAVKSMLRLSNGDVVVSGSFLSATSTSSGNTTTIPDTQFIFIYRMGGSLLGQAAGTVLPILSATSGRSFFSTTAPALSPLTINAVAYSDPAEGGDGLLYATGSIPQFNNFVAISLANGPSMATAMTPTDGVTAGGFGFSNQVGLASVNALAAFKHLIVVGGYGFSGLLSGRNAAAGNLIAFDTAKKAYVELASNGGPPVSFSDLVNDVRALLVDPRRKDGLYIAGRLKGSSSSPAESFCGGQGGGVLRWVEGQGFECLLSESASTISNSTSGQYGVGGVGSAMAMSEDGNSVIIGGQLGGTAALPENNLARFVPAYATSTATATPSPSPSPLSPSSSATASISTSPSRSVAPSASPSRTATRSPVSFTATSTAAVTGTPSVSISKSASTTRTALFSPSMAASVSMGPSASTTATSSRAPPTPSSTPSASASFVPSQLTIGITVSFAGFGLGRLTESPSGVLALQPTLVGLLNLLRSSLTTLYPATMSGGIGLTLLFIRDSARPSNVLMIDGKDEVNKPLLPSTPPQTTRRRQLQGVALAEGVELSLAVIAPSVGGNVTTQQLYDAVFPVVTGPAAAALLASSSSSLATAVGLPASAVGGEVTGISSIPETAPVSPLDPNSGGNGGGGIAPSPPPGSNNNSSGGPSNNIGAIVGGILGGLALVAVAGVAAFILLNKRSKRKPKALSSRDSSRSLGVAMDDDGGSKRTTRPSSVAFALRKATVKSLVPGLTGRSAGGHAAFAAAAGDDSTSNNSMGVVVNPLGALAAAGNASASTQVEFAPPRSTGTAARASRVSMAATMVTSAAGTAV